jgi:hypothetical protein
MIRPAEENIVADAESFFGGDLPKDCYAIIVNTGQEWAVTNVEKNKANALIMALEDAKSHCGESGVYHISYGNTEDLIPPIVRFLCSMNTEG